MSLPKQLAESYEKIKLLNIHESLTKESVQVFVDILNQAIPSAMSPVVYAIYRFNRTKYLANPSRFVSEISGFHPYDSMILWTDFKDILSAFKLDGKIFLGWDRASNRYRGHILTKPTVVDKPTAEDFSDDMDEDMDRVYDYMQRRLTECVRMQN